MHFPILYRITVLGLAAVFFIFHYFRHHPRPIYIPSLSNYARGPHCPTSPLSRDIQLVLKTDASETQEKLPAHFETILRCVPNAVVYSDYAEDIAGHHVYDALDEISVGLKDTLPEFEFHSDLLAHGRDGLKFAPFNDSDGPRVRLENSRRKLDKWKQLPMADKIFRLRPNAKWYIFITADTYVVWPNLVAYLSHFRAIQPWYIGKHMYYGRRLLAHGGAGIALSNTALRNLTGYWNAHMEEYESSTQSESGADVALGKAMQEVDIPLFGSFPHFQGDSVEEVGHNATKWARRPWCFAPVTYSHMRPQEIRSLWNFEQRWYRWARGMPAVMKHRDVFKHYILPQIRPERFDWDNLSDGTEYSMDAFAVMKLGKWHGLTYTEKEGLKSFQKCRAVCESQPSCLQYSYSAGKCIISSEVRLGHKASSRENAQGSQPASLIQSGWMMERLSDYVKEMDLSCDGKDGNDWIT